MTNSFSGLSEHAQRLGIEPSAGAAGLQYPANRALRVEGPFGLSRLERLEERLITWLVDLAARAEVDMRFLPYYLQPGNFGPLALKAAIGAAHYAAGLLSGRTNGASAAGLEAVLVEAETPPQPQLRQQPPSPTYR